MSNKDIFFKIFEKRNGEKYILNEYISKSFAYKLCIYRLLKKLQHFFPLF